MNPHPLLHNAGHATGRVVNPTLTRSVFLRRTRYIPEMGDGHNGHARRDHGVRDAGLPEHNAHADGATRGHTESLGEQGAAQLLSAAGGRGEEVQQEPSRGTTVGQRPRGPVRLGREDAGRGAVRLLLRLHTHALARGRAVPEVRRQAYHGLRHTVHGHLHAGHAVRGAARVHAAHNAAVRRGARRGECRAMRAFSGIGGIGSSPKTGDGANVRETDANRSQRRR